MTLTCITTDRTVVVSTATYTLEVLRDRARAVLSTFGPGGEQRWTDLSLLASVDCADRRDETVGMPTTTVHEGDCSVEVVVTSTGTAWERKTVVLTARPEAVALRVEVVGTGRLDDVTLGGGAAIMMSGACGTFRSGVGFQSVFVPVPTEPVAVVRPASASAQLGVVGDAEPGRLHAIFSPPPLCFVFGQAPSTVGAVVPDDARWLGVSLVAGTADLTFTTARYDVLDGGWFIRLAYEGHTFVDGVWCSPELVLRPAVSPWQAIEDYRDEVAARPDVAVAPRAGRPTWWSEPIFCGWGAQCAANAALSRAGAGEPSADAIAAAESDLVGFVATAGVAGAAGLARQPLYDRWLTILDAAGLHPGTIVLDDRWQAEYGTCAPDTEKWPDLKEWIAGRHAAGQRVLLWFKAWDHHGIPDAECVLDALGRPVAVDPSNPAYLKRLGGIVREMIGPDGLNADGFKVDFTQRAPSGRTLRTHGDSAGGGAWGIAALHTLMATLHTAARSVKPDALVVNHTVDPHFAAVTDMIRLNDILERDVTGARVEVVDQLRFRAQVARAALPAQLVDTDQWPMPNRQQWLAYTAEQPVWGVPALYYLESIDNSGETIGADHLAEVARSWAQYRATR